MSVAEPDCPTTLAELRARIERIDSELLNVLKRRMAVVAEVAAYKRRLGAPIRDSARERSLLQARREQAEALGLACGPVESIYRQIMMASRDYQAALGVVAPTGIVKKTVVIVGGCGAMGQRLKPLFADLGHRVLVADVQTELRPVTAAAEADVVVVAVPIEKTRSVIEEIGPHVRKDALLMDVTSLKTEFMRAMLGSTDASVVGTHPMFGPSVHSLVGQRVVVCQGRGEAWYQWVLDMMEARGLVVTEATAEQHDRAMALVQVLTHFQTQVLGLAWSRSGMPLADSLKYTSPIYLMELYVAARHFAQHPALYGPIEMRNPLSREVTQAFCEAAAELAGVIAERDQERFAELFAAVRNYLGEFTAEALDKSSYLIDRLIELEMG